MGLLVGRVMPKVVMPMTDIAIRGLKANGETKKLHSVGGVAGLKIQLSASNSKSWIYRTTVGGKVRDIGLGSYPTISLRQAREMAANLKLRVLQGNDPIEDKTRAKAAAIAKRASTVCFAETSERYIQSIEAGWKNSKTAAQWRSSLAAYAFPVIGKLPVSLVDTANVMSVLEPIWKTKTETASRVRMRIENILAFATTRGYRTGDNPARWSGHLATLLPSPQRLKGNNHHPALPYRLAPAFCSTLFSYRASAPYALQLVLLTAARSSEVRASSWNEFDLDGALWNIQAGRMKSGKPHVVPLSHQAVRLLKRLKKLNSDNQNYLKDGFLFPNQRSLARPISDVALAKVIVKVSNERAGIGGEKMVDPYMGNRMATVHGFRSTFRDWAGEQSPFAREVIEHALAHQLKDKAEQAYQRGSLLHKRRYLMQAWADYLTSTE